MAVLWKPNDGVNRWATNTRLSAGIQPTALDAATIDTYTGLNQIAAEINRQGTDLSISVPYRKPNDGAADSNILVDKSYFTLLVNAINQINNTYYPGVRTPITVTPAITRTFIKTLRDALVEGNDIGIAGYGQDGATAAILNFADSSFARSDGVLVNSDGSYLSQTPDHTWDGRKGNCIRSFLEFQTTGNAKHYYLAVQLNSFSGFYPTYYWDVWITQGTIAQSGPTYPLIFNYGQTFGTYLGQAWVSDVILEQFISRQPADQRLAYVNAGIASKAFFDLGVLPAGNWVLFVALVNDLSNSFAGPPYPDGGLGLTFPEIFTYG